ncbi:hypothetical protein N7486_005267 [Penicillium sp. IBT 16267x]|nr:hypothetical protein N7486_005267 [Penicillium sp. IBT 16267x]
MRNEEGVNEWLSGGRCRGPAEGKINRAPEVLSRSNESNGENEGNGMANGEEKKRKRKSEVSSGLGFSGDQTSRLGGSKMRRTG